MIDGISYDEIEKYSQELQENSDIIKSLIENKDLQELDNFTKEVENYANYLKDTVSLYKSADEALDELIKQKRTSN